MAEAIRLPDWGFRSSPGARQQDRPILWSRRPLQPRRASKKGTLPGRRIVDYIGPRMADRRGLTRRCRTAARFRRPMWSTTRWAENLLRLCADMDFTAR